MLKPHKLCTVCRIIKKEPKLAKRLYDTSYYMKGSSISLRDIFEEYQGKHGAQFSYDALRNHVKKHQFMSEKDFNSKHLSQIAKQAEKKMLLRQIASTEVWDEVINQGMEKLRAGEINMKTADLLKAAKDKSDYEMKTKDQEMAMAMMVYHFASGENNESRSYDRKYVEGKTPDDFDPTDGLAGDSDQGKDGPGGVYYPPSWDAAPSGADTIPAGSPDF